MTEKGTVLKNISSLSLVQIANLVLPLVSIPIISRILGPEKYGVINYAATFIGYFNLLIDYGFNLTATRQVARDPMNIEKRNTIFREVLSTKIILFGISSFLFIIALLYIGPLSREKVVACFSFLTCIGAVLTQNWLFQAMQNLSKVAILNFVSRLVFTVLVLVIIKERDDYIWYPLLMSGVTIFISVISYYWAVRSYNLQFFFVGLARIKEILWTEKMVFFSMVVVSLYTTTNVVLLGIIQTDEQVGIYTAAQRLIVIAMSVVNMPLTQALYPFIGKAFGESRNEGLKTIQRFTPLIVCFTGFVVLSMFVLGPIALNLLYGEAFSSSLLIFRILCIMPLIIGLSNIFGVQIMLNMNMDKTFFFVTSAGACLGLLFSIVLTSYLGNIGTALNWVLVECFIVLAMYVVLRQKGINPINFKLFQIKELSRSLINIKNLFRRNKK